MNSQIEVACATHSDIKGRSRARRCDSFLIRLSIPNPVYSIRYESATDLISFENDTSESSSIRATVFTYELSTL